MKLEKGEISSSELTFLIGGFIQGSLLTIAFANEITKHDTWLAILAGLVTAMLFALVYIALAQKFPGKNLVQINDIIYGPYLGKLISAPYIFLFLSIVAANLRFIADFFLTFLMPETPMIVIIVMFALICAWAVRGGIEVIARTSFVFVVITVFIISLVSLLLLKEMDFTNFLPIFEVSLRDFIQSTHVIASIPFCEVLVFLMVIPSMNKLKQAKSSVLQGLMIGGVTILIIVVRNIAVLGSLYPVVESPSVEAVRLIDIAKIITRLEVLVAIVLLVTLFLKVSVFYYSSVLGLAQLLNMRSYVPLVLPLGIISIVLALTTWESKMEFEYIASNIWPIYVTPFYLMIPLMSLVIAKLRKLPKKQGG